MSAGFLYVHHSGESTSILSELKTIFLLGKKEPRTYLHIFIILSDSSVSIRVLNGPCLKCQWWKALW